LGGSFGKRKKEEETLAQKENEHFEQNSAAQIQNGRKKEKADHFINLINLIRSAKSIGKQGAKMRETIISPL